MTQRVTLTDRARADLAEIAENVHDAAGPITGERVVHAFRSAFMVLARQPRAGHRRDDLSYDPLVLFWPVHAWLIAYVQHADHVVVLAVVHGARNPGTIRESLAETYPPAAED